MQSIFIVSFIYNLHKSGDHRGRDRIVGGFITTYAINVYHHSGRWFSPDTPVSSTYKTDRYDITEILLKVALNTIFQNSYATLVLAVCI